MRSEISITELSLNGLVEDLFYLIKEDALAFWLDSSLSGVHGGRWSFLGSNPSLVFQTVDNSITIKRGDRIQQIDADPLDELAKILEENKLERPDTDIPFLGGAVGYLSYDLARTFELLPALATNDLSVPDIHLAFYDSIVAIDHLDNRTYHIQTGAVQAHAERTRDLNNKLSRLATLGALDQSLQADPWREESLAASEIESLFSREQFCTAVEAIRSHIVEGTIYQANLTQRFDSPLKMEPFQLYRRLRALNPAPFSAYIDCGDDLRILSSSPERFLQLNGRSVESRPIKGTRPRGQNQQEDTLLGNQLRSSQKDQSELVMIVDLERNDLGKVCSFGSVTVPELFSLEKYATVYHLVSTIKGELRDENTITELLRATFPSGSITGAPKLRAMELIEELEPVRRGIYTGSIGYIGYDGNADFNVAIRTLINRDKQIHLQVGGGIVYDSDPDLEYQETLDKAKALFESLGITNFCKEL